MDFELLFFCVSGCLSIELMILLDFGKLDLFEVYNWKDWYIFKKYFYIKVRKLKILKKKFR